MKELNFLFCCGSLSSSNAFVAMTLSLTDHNNTKSNKTGIKCYFLPPLRRKKETDQALIFLFLSTHTISSVQGIRSVLCLSFVAPHFHLFHHSSFFALHHRAAARKVGSDIFSAASCAHPPACWEGLQSAEAKDPSAEARKEEKICQRLKGSCLPSSFQSEEAKSRRLSNVCCSLCVCGFYSKGCTVRSG